MQILDNYVASVKDVKKELKPKKIVNTDIPDEPPPPNPGSFQMLAIIDADDLPKPSAVRRQPSEIDTDSNEVNFNKGKSHITKSKVSSKILVEASEKEKKYDDKVIPGTKTQFSKDSSSESSATDNPSVPSQNLHGSSCKDSQATESSDSSLDFSLLEKSDPVKAFESLKTCMKTDSLSFNDAVALMGTPFFEYKELYEATDGFNSAHKLGAGAFGTVYYGYLRCSKCAIKKLEEDNPQKQQNQKSSQLRSELGALLRYRHENIVSLYGYAIDGPALCLVYQHMTNGSLEDRLQCKGGSAPLPWSKRINIAGGAARGLHFLHHFDSKPLVHGDIKSANILLDKYFEAKIGDLGQAQHANSGALTGKFTHITQKNVSSKIYGTKAYLAPELMRGSGNLSTKSDVHAFGVVLLELCSGEKPYDERREGTNKFLKSYFNELQDEAQDDEKLCKLFQDKRAGECPDTFVMDLIKCSSNAVKDRKKERIEMEKLLHHLEAIEERWKETESFSSDVSFPASVQSNRLSHESGPVSSVPVLASNPGSMIGQPPQTDKANAFPASPIDFFKGDEMPMPFRLAQLYDKQKDPSFGPTDLKTMPESLRLQMLADARKEGKSLDFDEIFMIKAMNKQEGGCPSQQDFPCDPKKVEEIKRFDAELNGGNTSPTSLQSDPKKLDALKQFDREKPMIREPDESSEVDTGGSDVHKLQKIEKFDRENSIESMHSGHLFGSGGSMPSGSALVREGQALVGHNVTKGSEPIYQTFDVVNAGSPVQSVCSQTSAENWTSQPYSDINRQSPQKVARIQSMFSQGHQQRLLTGSHSSVDSTDEGLQQVSSGSCDFAKESYQTIIPADFNQSRFLAQSVHLGRPGWTVPVIEVSEDSTPMAKQKACQISVDSSSDMSTKTSHNDSYNAQKTSSLPDQFAANGRGENFNVVEEPHSASCPDELSVIYRSNIINKNSTRQSEGFHYSGVTELGFHSANIEGEGNVGGKSLPGIEHIEEGESIAGQGHIVEGEGHYDNCISQIEVQSIKNPVLKSFVCKGNKMDMFFDNYQQLLAEECDETVENEEGAAEIGEDRAADWIDVQPQEGEDNLDDSITDISV